MKHNATLFILFLLVFAQPSIAQTRNTFQKQTFVGVHGSPTLYIPRWNFNNDQYKLQPLVGFMTGVSFQYNFLKHFELHVELNYEETGYRSIAQNPCPDCIIYNDVYTGNMFALPSNFTHRYQYLSLPVSLKFNMIKRERFAFFLDAGINFRAFLGEDLVAANYYTGETLYAFHYDRKEKYLGGLAGLGVDFTLTKRVHVFIEARDYFFNRRLTETDNMELTQHSFQLIVGLTYRLNQ
ncbi:MAG TPA: outer membrane beta-barrel protein [Bacteroidia bacterium]|jgi:hypothetical protein|nr:outer membrane beta-barrel protein [Bacteroidia bacterium]